MPESEIHTDPSHEQNGEASTFALTHINDNSDGWGPNNQPEKYKDLPYQKFSKSDRIGKVTTNFSFIYLKIIKFDN